MSIEVEIKVKIQNRKQIMDSLKKIGFLENRCVVETDIYYTSTRDASTARPKSYGASQLLGSEIPMSYDTAGT